MNKFSTIKDFFNFRLTQKKIVEQHFIIYFVKKNASSELLNSIVLEDLNLKQPDLLPYNFLGSSTILSDSILDNRIKSLSESICHQSTFKSIKELIHFVEKVQNNNLSSQLFNKIKGTYIILSVKTIPPAKLRHRISGTNSGLDFNIMGGILVPQIKDVLKAHSRYKKEHLLDWGCGCGRVAIHLLNDKNINYVGADIDAECITWCKKNLSQKQFFVNNFYPPLSFSNEQFTIVSASSVMTHLDKYTQQIWLKEIYRILQPNGLFMATTLGKTSAKLLGIAEQFAESEYIDRKSKAMDGIAPKDRYKDTFQTKKYISKKWTKYFDILEYKEQKISHQDLVVMRKK